MSRRRRKGKRASVPIKDSEAVTATEPAVKRRKPKYPPIYIRKASRVHLARCLEALPGVQLGDFLDDLILRHGGAAVLDHKNGNVWGAAVWPEELEGGAE